MELEPNSQKDWADCKAFWKDGKRTLFKNKDVKKEKRHQAK